MVRYDIIYSETTNFLFTKFRRILVNVRTFLRNSVKRNSTGRGHPNVGDSFASTPHSPVMIFACNKIKIPQFGFKLRLNTMSVCFVAIEKLIELGPRADFTCFIISTRINITRLGGGSFKSGVDLVVATTEFWRRARGNVLILSGPGVRKIKWPKNN